MITSYEQMTYTMYNDIMGIIDRKGSDPEIIALLAGMTEDEVMTLPLEDYFKLKEQAGFLMFQPKPHELRKVYEIGAFRLVPVDDIRHIITAQYEDWQNYCKQDGDITDKILSVLLIPEGKSYADGYDVIAVQQAIREHMCVLDAIVLRNFFRARLAKLMRASLTSLIRMTRMIPERGKRRTMRTMIRQRMRFLQGGDGSYRWMQFLRLPTALLKRSIDYRYLNF